MQTQILHEMNSILYVLLELTEALPYDIYYTESQRITCDHTHCRCVF